MHAPSTIPLAFVRIPLFYYSYATALATNYKLPISLADKMQSIYYEYVISITHQINTTERTLTNTPTHCRACIRKSSASIISSSRPHIDCNISSVAQLRNTRITLQLNTCNTMHIIVATVLLLCEKYYTMLWLVCEKCVGIVSLFAEYQEQMRAADTRMS